MVFGLLEGDLDSRKCNKRAEVKNGRRKGQINELRSVYYISSDENGKKRQIESQNKMNGWADVQRKLRDAE